MFPIAMAAGPALKILTNKYVLIPLIIVGILVGMYLYGKKAATMEPVKLPTDDPGSGIKSNEVDLIKRITEDLHDDMNKLNATGHDDEVYSDFMELSDRLFVAVYNEFTLKYADSGKTLRGWLESEHGFNIIWGALGGLAGDQGFKTLKKGILARMDKLNLK